MTDTQLEMLIGALGAAAAALWPVVKPWLENRAAEHGHNAVKRAGMTAANRYAAAYRAAIAKAEQETSVGGKTVTPEERAAAVREAAKAAAVGTLNAATGATLKVDDIKTGHDALMNTVVALAESDLKKRGWWKKATKDSEQSDDDVREALRQVTQAQLKKHATDYEGL